MRPNVCVAMVLAPECFDPANARHALEIMKSSLVGPLGIKTLDPKDWAYRGIYENGNDSDDPSVAHGFNYHQGPVNYNLTSGMAVGYGLFPPSISLFLHQSSWPRQKYRH